MKFRSIYFQIRLVLFFVILPSNQSEEQTNKARKMNSNVLQSLEEQIYPRPWDLSWRLVNLSVTDENDFILTPCYHDLAELPKEILYNKTFRIRMKSELVDKKKTCQVRFPSGVHLRYRLRFKDSNTHVFFAYGNSKERMVLFSRKLSSADWPGIPETIWKGLLRVPCKYSLLIFNPFVGGEEFEFHILGEHEYLDKCSAWDAK